MDCNPIRQRVLVTAPVADVYALFLDAGALGELLGEPVGIEPQEGGAFRLGGNAGGRIVKLEEPRLIVQAWRRDDWPVEEYSIAVFRFQDLGERTQLIFSHTGVPAHCAGDVRQMWYRLWQDLKRRFQPADGPGGTGASPAATPAAEETEQPAPAAGRS